MKRSRWIAVLLCLLLVLGLLAGCSAKSEASDSMDAGVMYGGVYDAETAVNGTGSTSDTAHYSQSEAAGVTSQKLIRTMTLEAETNDMDTLLGELNAKVTALKGYVENKSVRNGGSTSSRRYRYANLTIRVPAESLDAFIEHVSGATNVVYYNEDADDITLSYVATESRVKALQTEEERLLELLAQAENMSDLLQIEQRLTDVRTELEEVASQLRLYDNLVDYGTVNLSVTEVQEYTVVEEESVWQRIANGLAESWKGLTNGITELFIFLVVSMPYLIPIAAIVIVIVLLAKRASRKKKAKKQEPPQPAQEA